MSESEPIADLEGWTARRLRPAGKPEWLTCMRRPAVAEQLDLVSS